MSIDNFIVRPTTALVEKYQARRYGTSCHRKTANERPRMSRICRPPWWMTIWLPSNLIIWCYAAARACYGLILLSRSRKTRITGIASRLEELGNVPNGRGADGAHPGSPDGRVLAGHRSADPRNPAPTHTGLVKLIEPRNAISSLPTSKTKSAHPRVSLPKLPRAPTRRASSESAALPVRAPHHITIQKLRRNEQLTPQDIAELERMFLARACGAHTGTHPTEGGRGLAFSFARSSTSIAKPRNRRSPVHRRQNPHAKPIEFVNLVVDHLTERGVMDPRRLYESPFTDMDDQGVSGVFHQPTSKCSFNFSKQFTTEPFVVGLVLAQLSPPPRERRMTHAASLHSPFGRQHSTRRSNIRAEAAALPRRLAQRTAIW